MTQATTIVCPHCGTLNRVPPTRPTQQAKCGGCHAALFDGRPVAVDETRFERHLRHDSVPVLLDVWAPWCGPCRMMAPMFERAATALEPDVRLLKLNADEAPRVSAQPVSEVFRRCFCFTAGGRSPSRQERATPTPSSAGCRSTSPAHQNEGG
jgi:thioredoxin 2